MQSNFVSPSSLPKFLSKNGQECKNFISSLPKEKGWVEDDYYQYQGFWHTSRSLEGTLNCQQQFQAEENDILLATHPKSGTTWLKALIFAVVYRGKFITLQDHPLLTNNPHHLVPFVELNLHKVTRIPDSSFPRLLATHLPFVSLPDSVKDKSCKIVYVCRDPKDLFVSLFHFLNNQRTEEMGSLPIEEAFDKFCGGVTANGPVWDHVLDYWKESLKIQKKVFFVRYEDMKEQPEIHLKRLADFLGYKFSVEEETNGRVDEILKLCSFDNLRNTEVNKHGKSPLGHDCKNFFRKGKVKDWKNHLTPEMVETIDRITEQKLQGSSLKL